MKEIFINYRTGDGEKTAALLDQALESHFGREHVFRASRSIAPGQAYPDALLRALRGSSVLLAVIGRDWVNFRSRLSDPQDWVRKEILEAFACALPVVPVLDGRQTDRLSKAQLPPELALLADLQSVPLDTADTESGIRRIVDAVTDIVPGLRDLSQAQPQQPAPGTVHNSISDVAGTAVQTGNFTGDVAGTVLKDTHGTIHTGSGNVYHNSRHVSGDRHFSGSGMTYFEGDTHGGVHNGSSEPDRREDDSR